MDKRMKATFAVVLALAFVLGFAIATTDTSTDVSGENSTVIISEDQTYHDGDTFVLNADYKLEPGVVLTFEPGATLSLDAITPWSVEGGAESGFYFQEGSKVLFSALIFQQENIIDEDTSIAMKGKVSYGFTAADSKFNISLTISNGTVGVVNGLTYNFKETSVSIAPEIKLASGELSELKADVKVKSDGVTVVAGELALGSVDKIDISLNAQYVAPTGTSDKYSVALKGDASVKANVMGITVETSDKIDLTVGIQGITEDIDWTDPSTLKDVIPFMSGSMSGDLKVNADLDMLKIDNSVIQYSASFSDREVKLNIGADVDSIGVKTDGVEGYINDISLSEELTIELGSYMKLLSGRNILGTAYFFKSYDMDVAQEDLKEFIVDFLTPVIPDGFDVNAFADYLISEIPEEDLYTTAMPFAYALYFVEEIDGKDFGQMCIDTYNSITEEGYVTKYLAYIGALAGQIGLSIAGTDDIEGMDIEGYSTFSIGTITAESDKGYNFSSDGCSFTATIDDGIAIEGTVNSMTAIANSEKIVSEMVTPVISAKCSVDKDGIEAEYSVEGDLKFSIQDKSNDIDYVDLSYVFHGIDVTQKIKIGEKTAEYSSSEIVDSIDIIIGDFTATIGTISEHSSMAFDSGSITDIFSLRNLDYITEFILTVYDEDMNLYAYELVLDDILISAYPSIETEELIDEIIENTPEELLPIAGAQSQYILFVFEKENLNLKTECEKIAASIKDISTVEGATEYFSKVVEEIFEVETGIKDFVAPSFTATFSAEIGTITAVYEGESLTFNGASCDISIDDDSMSASAEFKGLDFSYADEELDVEFVLPTVSVTMSESSDIYMEYSVNGDFVFKYLDPQDKYNSYVWAVDDIDSSSSVRFNDDGTADVTLGLVVGDVFVSYDMRETNEYAFFMLDGADIIVRGTVDLTSVIDAIISQDYSDIIADVEVKESLDGVMYNQMLDKETSRFGKYKAAIDGLDVEISASNGENGFKLDATASIAGGYHETERHMVSLDDTTCTISLINGEGTIEYTGDYERIKFGNGETNPKGEAYGSYVAEDMVIKAKIVIDEDGFSVEDITEASGNVSINDYGITADFGKVILTGDYSTGDFQLESDKITISGNYTGIGDLKSISGTINGVVLIPSNDSAVLPKYKDADIEYTFKDGNKLRTTLVPNDTTKIFDIECITSGDANGVIYDLTNYHPESVIYKVIDSEYYESYTDKYTVSGEVPLIMNYVDCTVMDMNGKVYFTNAEIILNDDTVVYVYFTGAKMCVDFGKTGGPIFSISALPGYDLNPEDYHGFTVDANNNVTIEFNDGVGVCGTKSIGKEYNLTINGHSQKVRYGDEFIYKYTGGDEPLWFVDGNGEVRGYVYNSTFFFEYDEIGDLTLTPVFGTKAATGAPGATVKVDADAFFVQPADEPFAVENKAGVRFVITGTSLDSYQKFSATETKYDGHKAYEIEGNTSANILVPISTYDAFAYHVVNDTAVPVVTEIVYDADADQYYAGFYANTYSVYFVEEIGHEGNSSDNTMIYTAIIVAIIVVIAIAALVASKKKTA